MQRLLSAFLILLSLFGLFGQLKSAHAEALPAANWYAVAWNHQADQLFWINAQGSQAMIDRPQIPDEKPNGMKSLHFSRNGKTMVVIAEQNDNRYGIGFYDLEAGQFYVVHQTAPGEVVGPVAQPSTPSSDRMALVLYNPQTLAYRFLDFEIPSGNAVHQLASTDPGAPQAPAGTVPFVVLYDIDQGTNKYMVHFQFKSVVPNEVNGAYIWFPDDVQNPIGNGAYKDNEFDIKWPDNQVIYGLVHPDYNFIQNGGSVVPANMLATYYAGNSPQSVHLDEVHILRYPKWLNNGQWIGYRAEGDQVMPPRWEIKDLANDASPVPLGPNFSQIWGTPDGFLALDLSAGKIYHSTTANFEGFSAVVGNSVFTFPVPQTVTVPYVTPLGAQFQLTNVGDPETIFAGPDDLAAPSECPDAPPTRLTVGGNARVAYTDGTALNVRTEANGDILATQMTEGTEMSVLQGPVCAGGYNWWMIQPTNGEVGGWSAEGADDEYWLEPILTLTIVTPPISTVPPRASVPTSTPPPRAMPTATIGGFTIGDCSQAPSNYLAIGYMARVADLDGTLALRSTPSAATPFAQLNTNTVVNITGGYQCHNGFRYWEVSATQNNQVLNGWVADGLNSKQYLVVMQ